MRKFLFLSIFILNALFAFAQAPQKFNYQGVARDASGKALIQTDVTLQVAIVSSNDLDRPIYLEEHTVNTGKLGMFNLQIGGGDVLEGNMDQIDWGASSHFLSIRMDTEGMGNFQEMGISQLLSVPYALYAEKSGTAAFSEEGGSRNDPNDWTMSGNAGTDENLNFIGTTDAQDLVVKTNGSEVARFTTEGNIELNANASIKAGTQNILNAIGTRNIHIGRDAGAVSTGSQNSFIGSSAGSSNTTGYDNAFIGPGAGRDNTTGYRNVFIGFSTGRTNTTGYRNTFIGGQSGFSNTEGFGNSGIGFRTGYANTTGIRNTFIGDYAGQSNTTGYFNTYVGKEADGAPDIFNATAIGAGAYAAESNTVILGNGVNVGIGTSAPQSELHVVGNIRMADGNQSDGHVLTSDANGTASWQPLTTLADGLQIGDTCYSSVVLDQFAETEDNITPFQGSHWQSFRPELTGYLHSVELSFEYGYGVGGYIRIYEGQGTGGTLLYELAFSSASAGWNEFTFPSQTISLTEDDTYTIRIQGNNNSLVLDVNWNNIYTRGRSDAGGDDDLLFRTYMQGPCEEHYALLADAADGTVTINHVDTVFFADDTYQTTAATDDQTLTLSGNTLSIEDGNSVSLSGFVNTDNQQLTLSGYTLGIEDGNSVELPADTLTIISDADADTKIQLEESADEDIIRFDVGGSEVAQFRKNASDQFQLMVAPVGTSSTNVFIGNEETGMSNTSELNVAIGPGAFRTNTTGYSNVAIGSLALQGNTSGLYNTALNEGVLYDNTTGDNNIGIGAIALLKNTTGSNNIGLGFGAGYRNTTGSGNILLGYNAGYGNSSHAKSNNVMIGHEAGSTNEGDANVFLGYQAGKNESGSNRLYIENSNADSTAALIYGEFDNDFLALNASVRINDGTQADGYILSSDANGNASWIDPDNITSDSQTLALSGDTLSISNGNSLVLPSDSIWIKNGSALYQNNSNYASGSGFAAGQNSFANGSGTVAIGLLDTVNSAPGVAIGMLNSTGLDYASTFSSVLGHVNQLNGRFSTVVGYSNTLEAGNNAQGSSGIFGAGNTVNTFRSYAFGRGNTLSGSQSYLIGETNTDNSDWSFGMGASNSLNATQTFALGYWLTANSYQEMVFGSFNDTIPGVSANAWVATDPAFTFGIGQDPSIRANALVILKNGNAGFGTNTPDTTFHLVGKMKYQDGTQANGYVLTSDANGNATWQAAISSSSPMVFDTLGGVVMSGNAVNVASDDFVFGSSQLDDDGNSAHYNRMFFDKSEGAFRAGFAITDVWNANNIGEFSVAFGENTTASGDGSFAMGDNSIASGIESTAFGFGAQATGETSFSAGNHTEASGESSVALGHETMAGSFGETAMGLFNTEYSPGSSTSWEATDRVFSIGNGTDASNRSDAMVILKNGNTGIGTSTPDTTFHLVGKMKYQDGTQANGYVLTSDANGNASWQEVSTPTTLDVFETLNGVVLPGSAVDETTDDFVFGSTQLDDDGNTAHDNRFFFDKSKGAFRAGQVINANWDNSNIGTASFATGYGTKASGNYSTAIGLQSTASGTSSTAMGYGTMASGDISTAMGYQTTASGNTSIAMGNSATASGGSSIALGNNTTASGNTSMAMGSGTTANSSYSTAMGAATTASGYASTAMGAATTAASGYETVIGTFNTTYTPNNTGSGWHDNDRMFVIGNGTGTSNRSDAMVVLKSGNTGLGISAPSATLDVVGTLQYVDGTQADGRVLTSDANGNASWQPTIPVGSVQMYVGTTVPDGWLLCNGGTFVSGDYPLLYAVLGNSNTLPDLRGRFPLGTGNNGGTYATQHNLGDTGGFEKHQLTVNEMPAHTHGLSYTQRSFSGSNNGASDFTGSGASDATGSAGGNVAHNNMPPFYTLNFIIKAR